MPRASMQMTADELARLRSLLDKDAIRDVLSRYARGIDRIAPDLVRSVYHADAIDIHGTFRGDRDEFAERSSRISPDNLCGHHAMTHSHIELEGDTARVETYFIHHFERFARKRNEVRAGVMVGRYLDRMERRAGEWRIAVRRVVVDVAWEWPKGDEPPGAKTFPRGARWPDDEVFHLDRLFAAAQADGEGQSSATHSG